jgi:thiol:disulfide interchange protein
VSGIAVAAAVGVFSYEVLGPHEKVLPWQPYSSTALSQAQAEGKTVLVDFTADWCATCKVNLKLSIDTEKVKAVVEQNGVVPMLADWTDESEEIKSTINGLGFQTIPLLVIYPAGKPNDVIVLKDTVTQTQVIEALERAGPSKGSAQTKVAAVTGSD